MTQDSRERLLFQHKCSHEEVGHEVRLGARGVDAVGCEVDHPRRPQHVVVNQEEATAEGVEGGSADLSRALSAHRRPAAHEQAAGGLHSTATAASAMISGRRDRRTDSAPPSRLATAAVAMAVRGQMLQGEGRAVAGQQPHHPPSQRPPSPVDCDAVVPELLRVAERAQGHVELGDAAGGGGRQGRDALEGGSGLVFFHRKAGCPLCL